MRHIASLIVLAIFGAACAFFFPASTVAQTSQMRQVRGRVTDAYGTGLPDIDIEILAPVVSIASKKTGEDGRYSIQFKATGAVNVVFHGDSIWFPSSSLNLAGTNMTGIDLKLIKIGEMSANNSAAKVAIETIVFLSKTNEFSQKALEFAKVIDPSDFPKELQDRVFQINVLARLKDAERRASEIAVLSGRIDQTEQNNQRLSGQIDELGAVSNAARGGARAAQETADAAIAGVNATNERISTLDDYLPVPELNAIVIFNAGSTSLTPEALKQLDEIARKVVGTKGYRMEISGFADAVGSKQREVQLSQQRAEEVARYLTGNYEIPLWRISPPIGYGDARAIDNRDPGEKQGHKNRVEVRVLVNRGITGPTMQIPATNQSP